MRDKLLLIYNPKAGRGTFGAQLNEALIILRDGGYRVEVYPTRESGDAMVRAMEVEDDIDVVCCAGGDGTLNEVINGLMRTDRPIPLGYLPVGSTNDFAASIGLDTDIVRSAKVIVERRTQPVDIGAFNEDYFSYVAAFGAFTNVAYDTDQNLKNIFGHAAYILNGITSLSSVKAYPVRLRFGDTETEGRFLYGMVTNSVSVGGIKNITGKYVELADGKFEVTMIREPKTIFDLQEIAAALLGGNENSEFLLTGKADEITVESDEPLAWTLDGEFGGDHRTAKIVNRKHALRMLMP